MKNTVIKYGLYGLITGIILFLAAILLGKGLSYSTQEVLGYVSMVACLSFVFFGIKHYRDLVNNGILSIGKALVIGILISVLVGVGVAIAGIGSLVPEKRYLLSKLGIKAMFAATMANLVSASIVGIIYSV
mgnify:CR=1 FL=1